MSEIKNRADNLELESDTEETTSEDFEYGYVVGVKKDDNTLLFEGIGDGRLGVVELLGLHKYASFRINQLIEASQNSLDFQTLKHIVKTVQKLEELLLKMSENKSE